MSQFPFFTDSFNVDVGKNMLQAFFSPEQDRHIVFVFKILDQGCIREHGLKGPAQRIVSGLFPVSFSQVPEEMFHDVVGPLRLNSDIPS